MFFLRTHLLHACACNCCSNFPRHNLLCSMLIISRRYYTSWVFPLWFFQRDLRALLALNIQRLPKFWILPTLCTPTVVVFNLLCSDLQLRLLLQPAHSLHGFNNPNPLLGEWEQELDYLSLHQRTPCGWIQLHTLHESPSSDRETLEPHSLSLSDFRLKHEITCTSYTKQMHTRKKTFMSINTQRKQHKPCAWIKASFY